MCEPQILGSTFSLEGKSLLLDGSSEYPQESTQRKKEKKAVAMDVDESPTTKRKNLFASLVFFKGYLCTSGLTQNSYKYVPCFFFYLLVQRPARF